MLSALAYEVQSLAVTGLIFGSRIPIIQALLLKKQ